MSTPIHHHPRSRIPMRRRRGNSCPQRSQMQFKPDHIGTNNEEEVSRTERIVLWIFLLITAALSGVAGWILWGKAQGNF